MLQSTSHVLNCLNINQSMHVIFGVAYPQLVQLKYLETVVLNFENLYTKDSNFWCNFASAYLPFLFCGKKSLLFAADSAAHSKCHFLNSFPSFSVFIIFVFNGSPLFPLFDLKEIIKSTIHGEFLLQQKRTGIPSGLKCNYLHVSKQTGIV